MRCETGFEVLAQLLIYVQEEISAMKRRVAEMEEEAAKLREIQAHFQSCGSINRVTILLDKFTGHPKGFVPRFPI